LYTRQNCPLCDKAKAVLTAAGVVPKEVDVDLDLDLLRRYDQDVPVVYIGGTEAVRHPIEGEVVDGHPLEREFRVHKFSAALAFTNKIGAVAEAQNHHPDIELGWGKVRVRTWSHDAGRITARDFRLAGAIDRALQ